MSAGTSGDISLSLYGTHGELLNFPLNTPTTNNKLFEQGGLDRFLHNYKNIGKVI